MIQSITKVLLLCCIALSAFSSNLFASLDVESKAVNNMRPFFLLSVPKSGTHLLTKLLVMMTKRQPDSLLQFVPLTTAEEIDPSDLDRFEYYMLNAWKQGRFPFQHARYINEPFATFMQRHPEFVPIVVVRDLRDVVVSLAYHRESDFFKELGEEASVEKRITYILNLSCRRGKGIYKSAQAAIAFRQNPNVLTCRFEEFVGSQGGATDKLQKKSISRLASSLGIELTNEELNTLAADLFGNETGPQGGNFRKGQIGSWKDHFTEEHMELFRQNWSALQSQLGYPTL